MLTGCCGMQLRQAGLVIGWIDLILDIFLFIIYACALSAVDVVLEDSSKICPHCSKEELKTSKNVYKIK